MENSSYRLHGHAKDNIHIHICDPTGSEIHIQSMGKLHTGFKQVLMTRDIVRNITVIP